MYNSTKLQPSVHQGCSLLTDYSEDRVVALINADLADTLGNLVQRVTAKKLHPSVEGEKERPTVTELESEWKKMSENEEDRSLIDHLRNLTGLFFCMCCPGFMFLSHACNISHLFVHVHKHS